MSAVENRDDAITLYLAVQQDDNSFTKAKDALTALADSLDDMNNRAKSLSFSFGIDDFLAGIKNALGFVGALYDKIKELNTLQLNVWGGPMQSGQASKLRTTLTMEETSQIQAMLSKDRFLGGIVSFDEFANFFTTSQSKSAHLQSLGQLDEVEAIITSELAAKYGVSSYEELMDAYLNMDSRSDARFREDILATLARRIYALGDTAEAKRLQGDYDILANAFGADAGMSTMIAEFARINASGIPIGRFTDFILGATTETGRSNLDYYSQFVPALLNDAAIANTESNALKNFTGAVSEATDALMFLANYGLAAVSDWLSAFNHLKNPSTKENYINATDTLATDFAGRQKTPDFSYNMLGSYGFTYDSNTKSWFTQQSNSVRNSRGISLMQDAVDAYNKGEGSAGDILWAVVENMFLGGDKNNRGNVNNMNKALDLILNNAAKVKGISNEELKKQLEEEIAANNGRITVIQALKNISWSREEAEMLVNFLTENKGVYDDTIKGKISRLFFDTWSIDLAMFAGGKEELLRRLLNENGLDEKDFMQSERNAKARQRNAEIAMFGQEVPKSPIVLPDGYSNPSPAAELGKLLVGAGYYLTFPFMQAGGYEYRDGKIVEKVNSRRSNNTLEKLLRGLNMNENDIKVRTTGNFLLDLMPDLFAPEFIKNPSNNTAINIDNQSKRLAINVSIADEEPQLIQSNETKSIMFNEMAGLS